MKIEPRIPDLELSQPASPTIGFTKGEGNRFKQILDDKKADLHQVLINMRDSLLNGKRFSSAELLTYQITAQNFALHLELISKGAEALNSGFKRLQTPG